VRLDAMDDAASRAYCETLFAPDLKGTVSFQSVELAQLPAARECALERRQYRAHTVTPCAPATSRRSGTRLAFDDAIALDRALGEAGDDVPRSRAFERERRRWSTSSSLPPIRARYGTSAWRTRWRSRRCRAPYDYMTRSGRVDDDRLRYGAAFHGRRA